MITRLIQCDERIFFKAELENPGGSHKYRAAKYIIQEAMKDGRIILGKTTIIEKTGGNFGFGLSAVCKQYNLPMDLAIGLSFSQLKRDLLEFLGANLIGKEMLKDGLAPKEVVHYYLENQTSMGKSYFYTDQFQNPLSVEVHRKYTGNELAEQLHQQQIKGRIIFVGGAGTGASFTGVSLALRDAGFDVISILVEPVGCDMRANIFSEHRIEGISVGVVAPFLDWSLVNGVQKISLNEIKNAQQWAWKKLGLFIGNSSAAAVAAALKMRRHANFKFMPMVTLIYDSGLWYSDWKN